MKKDGVVRRDSGMRTGSYLLPLFVLMVTLPSRVALPASQAEEPSPVQLRAWALQLGDDDFQKREEAQGHLAAAGAAALPYLKEALKSEDVEVRQRAEKLLAPLTRDECLAEAAQALGDPDWEKVSRAIDVLLDRCDVKSEQAVAQVAAGADRAAAMAKVLHEQLGKVRMSDAEIAKFIEVGKRNPAVQKVVEKKKDEVQRVYRQRAYEACLREFERLKAEPKDSPGDK